MSDRLQRGARWWDWLWLVGWGLASSCWCLSTASQLGPTYDEPFYVQAGLQSWRTGSHKFLVWMGTMPLPAELDTLPLYLSERWRGRPFDPAADLEILLPWARAGTLVFWWLLLIYGWRLGRYLGGPAAGRIAVALLACEPTLLAHAGLATTDVALAACLLALVYHFRTGRDGPWLRRVGLPGFWCAVVLLAKASGLLFGPLCLAVLEAERLLRAGLVRSLFGKGPDGEPRGRLAALARQVTPSARDLAQIVAVGLALMFLCCTDSHRPARPLTPERLGLSAGPVADTLVWFAEHFRSLPNGYKGLAFQVRHNAEGHGQTYLLGTLRPGTAWYYFPLALCIKLSVPVLALCALLALGRPRALANGAFLTAAALLGLSPLYRVQIGVRLVLPVVVLGVVGLAVALARAWPSRSAAWGRGTLAAAGAGVLWTACELAGAWPNALCYTNALWGGTANGYRYLHDSNYDWGQGLKELLRWQRRQGPGECAVWYFGTDPAVQRAPFLKLAPESLPLRGAGGFLSLVRGRYLAASTSALYGWYQNTEVGAYLRTCRPVARTTTFFIYDFTGKDDPTPGPPPGPTPSRPEAPRAAGPAPSRPRPPPGRSRAAG